MRNLALLEAHIEVDEPELIAVAEPIPQSIKL
jgi:hypothetical protein